MQHIKKGGKNEMIIVHTVYSMCLCYHIMCGDVEQNYGKYAIVVMRIRMRMRFNVL